MLHTLHTGKFGRELDSSLFDALLHVLQKVLAKHEQCRCLKLDALGCPKVTVFRFLFNLHCALFFPRKVASKAGARFKVGHLGRRQRDDLAAFLLVGRAHFFCLPVFAEDVVVDKLVLREWSRHTERNETVRGVEKFGHLLVVFHAPRVAVAAQVWISAQSFGDKGANKRGARPICPLAVHCLIEGRLELELVGRLTFFGGDLHFEVRVVLEVCALPFGDRLNAELRKHVIRCFEQILFSHFAPAFRTRDEHRFSEAKVSAKNRFFKQCDHPSVDPLETFGRTKHIAIFVLDDQSLGQWTLLDVLVQNLDDRELATTQVDTHGQKTEEAFFLARFGLHQVLFPENF